MITERFEYRVVWKRQRGKRKNKRFATLKAAERRIRLLGPEPWTAFERDPEEPWCCNGQYECGCGGITVREHLLEQRSASGGPEDDGMAPVEYVRIERRSVAAWEAMP